MNLRRIQNILMLKNIKCIIIITSEVNEEIKIDKKIYNKSEKSHEPVSELKCKISILSPQTCHNAEQRGIDVHFQYTSLELIKNIFSFKKKF